MDNNELIVHSNIMMNVNFSFKGELSLFTKDNKNAITID